MHLEKDCVKICESEFGPKLFVLARKNKSAHCKPANLQERMILMKKRILSLLLAAAMCAGLLATSALAESVNVETILNEVRITLSNVTAQGKANMTGSETELRLYTVSAGSTMTVSCATDLYIQKVEAEADGTYQNVGSRRSISNPYECEIVFGDEYAGAVWRVQAVAASSNTFLVSVDGASAPGQPTEPEQPETPAQPETPVITFPDVPAGEYFTTHVAWAVSRGIVNGRDNGTFDPYATCNQQEILLMLWRAEGQPAADKAPVAADDFAAGAVNWAYAQGMIDNTFDRYAPCTRATTVDWIWKANGSPAGGTASFDDVPAQYAAAVAWAVQKGVTYGTDTGFDPDGICNRAQIVTFLGRAFAE